MRTRRSCCIGAEKSLCKALHCQKKAAGTDADAQDRGKKGCRYRSSLSCTALHGSDGQQNRLRSRGKEAGFEVVEGAADWCADGVGRAGWLIKGGWRACVFGRGEEVILLGAGLKAERLLRGVRPRVGDSKRSLLR